VTEIWEKNKRFILIVVGGLVIVLFGWNYAHSSVSAASDRISLAQENIESSRKQINQAFLLREQWAKRESKLLQKDARLADRLESLIAPEPRDSLPEDNPGFELKTRITDAQKDINKESLSYGVKISAKSWGIGSRISARSTPDDLKTLQIRLAATKQIMRLAIVEARVKEIENIQQKDAVRLAIPKSEGEKDIELLPIMITCLGDAKSLARMAFEMVRERKDNTHNFYYLKEAEISDGRHKSAIRRTPGRRAGGDDTKSRRGIFTFCTLRIVKADKKSSRATTGRRPRRPRRR